MKLSNVTSKLLDILPQALNIVIKKCHGGHLRLFQENDVDLIGNVFICKDKMYFPAHGRPFSLFSEV